MPSSPAIGAGRVQVGPTTGRHGRYGSAYSGQVTVDAMDWVAAGVHWKGHGNDYQEEFETNEGRSWVAADLEKRRQGASSGKSFRADQFLARRMIHLSRLSPTTLTFLTFLCLASAYHRIADQTVEHKCLSSSVIHAG